MEFSWDLSGVVWFFTSCTIWSVCTIQTPPHSPCCGLHFYSLKVILENVWFSALRSLLVYWQVCSLVKSCCCWIWCAEMSWISECTEISESKHERMVEALGSNGCVLQFDWFSQHFAGIVSTRFCQGHSEPCYNQVWSFRRTYSSN